MSTILDKMSLVGSDKAGMFHIDKELDGMATATLAAVQQATAVFVTKAVEYF